MKRIYMIIACVALVACSASAQIFTQYIDEQELKFKVKQIDEFFRRFNYEVDYEGNTMGCRSDTAATDSIHKRKSLTTLLNLDIFKKGNKGLDSLSSGFLDYVMKKDIQIHYSDTTWMAEAKSTAVYGGKEYPITLCLRTEQVKDVIYKWVIFDVKCSLFKCMTDSCKMNISILPGAHGSSFVTVPEFVNLNAKNVRALFAKGYSPTTLAAFDFMVASGKMKLKNISKVKYYFHTGDYDFTVEWFEKEKSYNKGWLVSSIINNKKH